MSFAKKKLDEAIEKRDIVSYRKWFGIWNAEQEKENEKTMASCHEKIDKLQEKFVKDIARIRSR